MNWFFPHIPLLLIAVFVWGTRDMLRKERLVMRAITVRRAEKPVTFWAFVVTNVLWIGVMVFALAVWSLDVNGMRTG